MSENKGKPEASDGGLRCNDGLGDAQFESLVDTLVGKCESLQRERDRYRVALEKIANQDYRGNRSTESEIAWKALKAT